MNSTKVQFNAGTAIELSFATVAEGKEAQLFGEYFPKVMPIVADLGGKPMGSYVIGDSATKLGTPKMGAFFQWPDLDGFHKLHDDPRFLAIKGIRDEALSFFSNAHFFCVAEDTEVTFEEGQEYALVAEREMSENEEQGTFDSLVTLTPAPGASNPDFNAKQIHIARWDENSQSAFEAAKSGQYGTRDLFKFVINMPA